MDRYDIIAEIGRLLDSVADKYPFFEQSTRKLLGDKVATGASAEELAEWLEKLRGAIGAVRSCTRRE